MKKGQSTQRRPWAAPLVSALSLALVPTSSGLHDQEAAPAPSSAPAQTAKPVATDGGTTELDTVVVEAAAENNVVEVPTSTPTRLPLTMRETPQSVTIVNRERMEERSLNTVAEVLADTPGVSVYELDSERTLYYARGFEVSEFQIDGVPYATGANDAYGATPIYDTALYEQVEILRGANGLLSGPGYPSATVNLQRKRPGKEFGGYISSSIGRWDYYRFEGDVTVPLTKDGRIRSRFVGVYQERESYMDNYSEDKNVLYGIIEADLTDSTLLSLGYQWQESKPRAATWGAVPYFAADGSHIDLPRSTNWSALWSKWDRTAGTAFITLEQKIGDDWTIKGTYAHTESDLDWAVAYAGSGFPDPKTGAGMNIWRSTSLVDETRDSFDLYTNGKFDLFGKKHDIVMGFNYSIYESETTYLDTTYAFDTVIPNIFTWNPALPYPQSRVTGAYDVTTTEQYGGYLALRLKLADPLSLIVGSRLSNWETFRDNYDTSGKYTGSDNSFRVTSEFTPYAGLVFDVTENLSLYTSYTDIFDPQMGRDTEGNILEPIRGSNIEAGIKGEFFNRRLLATFSVFQAEQDNSYLTDWSSPPFPDGTFPSIPTGPITSRGFELELNGYITQDWSIHAGYTHVNTETDDGLNAQSNLPEDLVRISTNYRLTGKLNKLSVGTGMSWQSDTNNEYWGSTAGEIRQNGYFLFDVNAQYRITENLSASVTVKNLFDKTYYRNVGFYDGVYFGEPRNIQFSLRYKF